MPQSHGSPIVIASREEDELQVQLVLDIIHSGGPKREKE